MRGKISKPRNFESRVFLEKHEWETYCRRKPVRYINKKKDKVCVVCGEEGGEQNPLQHSHKISFTQGVLEFGLTPDFLDRDSNISTAHRKNCNKKVELSHEEICKYLTKTFGKEKPSYLTW